MLTEKEKQRIIRDASSDGYFGPFDWEDIERRINNCQQHIIDERKRRWEEIRKENEKLAKNGCN